MKHEAKSCPRCRREFECKSGSVTECQCSAVMLSEQELAFVASLYEDCLCAGCLALLQQEARSQAAGMARRRSA